MAISKQALLAELQKRKSIAEKPKFDFNEYTFEAQKVFFRSKGKRFRAVCASRRSGKSVGIAADMIDAGITQKGANLLYITQTQGAARNIIWGELIKIIEEFQIDCKIDNTRLTVLFNETKSRIYLAGAKDKNEVAKFRGYKLLKCYIDEAQSIRPSILTELINDVIIPALRDLRGSLYLTGTPGPVPAGPFYEYTHSENWFTHHWDAFRNPHMNNVKGTDSYDPRYPEKELEETLAEERVMRGIDVNDPSYIRETYGKWVEDKDSLVFKFNKSKNIYSELPVSGKWTYIMGVDLGWNDADALAVIGYNSHTKKVYLVEEVLKNKQNITELVKSVTDMKNRWEPVKIVMDAGALGKKIQEEIRSRHGLHMEAAEKSRKVEFIELLNDDLRTGKFQAPINSVFEEDCMLVTWDKDSILKNPERPKISDTYHSDACFTEDAEVTCLSGIKKIKDVQVGDKVLTHKGRFKKVTNVMNKIYKGNILELSIKGVKSNIKCTPEHRFYSTESKKCHKGSNSGQRVITNPPTWNEAQDLKPKNNTKPNSYLQYPKITQQEKNSHSNEFCFLIGYYLAEGSKGGNNNQITFACNKKEVSVKKILQAALTTTYPATRAANSPSTKWRIKNTSIKPRPLGTVRTRLLKGNSAINYIGNKELYKYLIQCKSSDNKTFPEDIIKYDETQALYCLAGYLFGDGHFASTGIRSSSISKSLNMGLKILYSKLNIGVAECKLNKAAQGIIIQGRVVNCKDQYSINVTKKDSVALTNLINSKKDLKELFKNKLIHPISIKNNTKIPTLYKALDKVTSQYFEGFVYNLEVEEDESYVVNDCAVHNCDAVLYAWRECRHYLSEKPLASPAPATNAYMDEMEKEEAASMQRKMEDPESFELEQQFEEDMNELDSITDIWKI